LLYDDSSFGFIGLYKKGRLIALKTNDVSQTSSGMADSVTLNYAGDVQPDVCKIFFSSGSNYIPVSEPLICQLE